MASSDPVGDMIAMIKNAYHRHHRRLDCPHSALKEGVAGVLRSEGYIEDFKVVPEEKRPQIKRLHLFLKYDAEGTSVITQIRRVSKPGRRVFRGVTDFDKVLDGLGVAVLSTSRGILSDREARRKRVGGEVLCKVW